MHCSTRKIHQNSTSLTLLYVLFSLALARTIAANPASQQDDPSTGLMTCYYCANVSSNLLCNRFAIDMPCAPGLTVCQNTHVMDHAGETVLVDKKCSTAETCSSQVGCHQRSNQTVCVACCDVAYCNVNVSYNQSTAIFSRRGASAYSSASPTRIRQQLSHPIFSLVVIFMMATSLLH